MNNFYKILGVAPEATPEQIKDAFRKLAQQYHPDRNGSTEAAAKFKQINEAYQTLGNASKRTIYNYDLRRERERAQTGEPVPRAGKASQPANEQEYRSPAYYQNNPRAAVRPVRKTPLWLRRFGQTIQILARVLIGAALGSVLIVVHAAILGDEILFVPIEMIFGAVFGAFAGLSLPEENQLERVLKEKFKDGYKLTESVFACLAGAYFGALIADLLAFQFDLDAELTLYGVSLAGCALFGMAANEDAFWTKVRLPRAYFELLFVFVRMLGIAVLFAGIMWCIDIALGFFNLIMEAGTAVYYGALSGLIIGSMAPSDLQAYARYASAYVGRFMVVLFVLLALIIGFASGVWLQEPVRALLGI